MSLIRARRRRLPGCYILPPDMLRRIALHGSPDQREAALDTLAVDQTLRLGRATYQSLESGARHGLLGVP
ncbi:MAG TPA: hypothetical protein VN760_04830, partial [Casimicrobiaceae bacterium]|nr:hypothetical protein [Casimicrobiaceae bacterium]